MLQAPLVFQLAGIPAGGVQEKILFCCCFCPLELPSPRSEISSNPLGFLLFSTLLKDILYLNSTHMYFDSQLFCISLKCSTELQKISKILSTYIDNHASKTDLKQNLPETF